MLKKMKKLPIGIQTFAEIIKENYCYVDKTPLIDRLINSGKYYFLSRPRRFGKSLFISTLRAAFSGERELFKGLYLENHWNWSVKYPVIEISFGGGVIQNRQNLNIIINEILIHNSKLYDITMNYSSNSGRFSELIEKLHQKFQQKVVILIDEYDKPILDNIINTEIAVEIREGLKDFYSVIKDSDRHIKFAFLTGVSKFSKVSLFSGLNNLTDITLDKRYATICGYTDNEIKTVFKEYLQDVDFKKLRLWYNGYNFLGESVYNPFDVLLYLDSFEFKNYWFETATPSFLIELLQAKQYDIFNLEKIETSEEILRSFDVEHVRLETLLFQTGYLTIESVEQLGAEWFYSLRYPNLEVKSSLTNYLLNYLSDAPVAKAKNQKAVYHALYQSQINDLEKIFHSFFASIPSDWYRKNQLANYEGYYASIFYCYFSALGLDVIPEDSSNHGRIDLTIKLNNNIYIIEFKVIEYDSSIQTNLLPAADNSALTQIKQKRYHEKYLQQAADIYLIGVEFSKDARNIVSFQWEQVSL
jgi:hypothetical protein